MLNVLLAVAGVAMMVFGAVMLNGWLGGKSKWFDEDIFDRAGTTKNDRQFLDLYFIVIVITPLLAGAFLIVYGLRPWL